MKLKGAINIFKSTLCSEINHFCNICLGPDFELRM